MHALPTLGSLDEAYDLAYFFCNDKTVYLPGTCFSGQLK